MTTPPGGRRRHLSVVPDLPAEPAGAPAPARGGRRAAGRLSLVEQSSSPATDSAPPPGTTAADLRTALAESGAAQPFLDHAATFGDDVDGLFAWLRDYGPVFTEREWAGDLLDHWTALILPGTTAIAAERFAASFLAMYDEDSAGMITGLLAETATSGRPEAVAMARVLGTVGPLQIRSTAAGYADHLVAQGLPEPSWAGDLGAGDWVGALGFADPARFEETLLLQLLIAGRPHVFSLLLDHRGPGGVKDCELTEDDGKLQRQVEVRAAVAGGSLVVHTRADAGRILRTALAVPVASTDPDSLDRVRSLLPLLRCREHLVSETAEVLTLDPVATRRAARVHRVKVTLARTTPAIWRRLEVASSSTLTELHRIIQAAFGWSGAHLWVFETKQGEYGDADPEMGFRDADRLTLADAAPQQGSKLSYVYDFGDDWRHAIVVEDISAAIGTSRPRCTAGRRAAPPEDCGGPIAYEQLLAGPRTGPAAAGFDPARFSTATVNESLGLLDP